MFDRRIIALMILLGSLVSAFLVVSAPTLPVWGERHLPHENNEVVLPLPIDQKIEQSVLWKRKQLDVVAIWLDTERTLPSSGALQLVVNRAGEKWSSLVSVQDISLSGVVPFVFDPPIQGEKNDLGSFELSLSEANERVYVRYQIDAH